MSYAQKLSELATQYGSDKATLGYMPLYAEYFARHGMTPENVKSVLEIGTNKGSSLRMWAEFFPNAQVHGIDITREYEIASNLDHPRIHTHLLNQGSQSELDAFVQHAAKDIEFDIITGENWWDGNLYNRRKIRPTRTIVQEFEQTGRLPDDFLNGREIETYSEYCEYRKSSAVIYDTHNPQMAFIGRL